MAILFQSVIADILVSLLTFVAVIYWYLTKNFNYWQKRNIAFVKPSLLFGNFKDNFLQRQPVSAIWVHIYNKLKDYKIGGVWFLNKPFLVVTDPEIIKCILVKDFTHFHDREMPVDEENNPLSANLFNLAGSKWRLLRAKLTPTFTSGKMKMMFSLMRECAHEFVEFVDQEARVKEEIEFREIFAKMTTDIIGTCAFGLQFNSMKNPDSEFRNMGRRVFNPSTPVLIGTMIYHVFPRLGKIFNIQFPPKDISDFFINAVKETVEFRENNKIKRNDFLQLLIELKNKEKIEEEYDAQISAKGLAHENDIKDFEISDNLLAAQAFVFFLAGFETSSTTMSFTLLELVKNPDIQEKLRQDIDRVLAENDGELSYESIKEMEYLDKVINEALRKYPPIPTLLRKCTKTYRVPGSGAVIEEGTALQIPVYALHHDPAHFPDPQRFDPERFSEEVKAQRHNYVYLPFGEGPRICIGMRFGLLQAKLGLAALLSRFELQAPPRAQQAQTQAQAQALDPKSFITSAKGGVWARVVPRKDVILTRTTNATTNETTNA